MAITVDTLNALIDCESIDFPSRFNEISKAITGTVIPSMALERTAAILPDYTASCRAQMGLLDKAIQRDLMGPGISSASLGNSIQSALDHFSRQQSTAAAAVAKLMDSSAAAVKLMDSSAAVAKMIDSSAFRHSAMQSVLDKSIQADFNRLCSHGLQDFSAYYHSTWQSVIDKMIQTDFSRLYPHRLSDCSALIRSMAPYYKAQEAIGHFFTSQIELSIKALDPLRHYYAELECDVNRVTVDISHGSERVIHAEYDRKHAIDLLTAIILLKDAHPRAAIDVKGDHVDSEGLFDCLDEHETHYAEFQGQVDINTEDDTDPIALMDFFQQLVEGGHIDESQLEYAQFIARRGERFFRRNFGRVFYYGLVFLGKASVDYALDEPVSAEEFRERERMMGDSVRGQLPKPSTGGNTRKADAWKKVPPAQFAKKVDELYDTANALLDGYTQYKSNTNWLGMLKLSDGFKPLLRTCKGSILDEVALLIPPRLKDSRSKKHKHGSSPLAFACELAARELNIKKKDNSHYAVEYLLKKYQLGGGLRGKERRLVNARKTAKKTPPQ